MAGRRELKSASVRTILFVLFSPALLWAAASYQAELLFPLEKWHNHSSSVVELPNGDLLAVWFHGSGERQADDVLIQGARWRKATGQWSQPFVMADSPGFPETNPVLFLDSRDKLYFFWPLIIANRWETALMKYRMSDDYRQESGPPRWNFQDNIVLIPRNMKERTEQLAGRDAQGDSPAARHAADLLAHANDKYFSRMGWFTRTHPLELPSGRLLLPMYSDGFSFGLMGISDDRGLTWTASEPIAGYGCIQPSVVRRNDGTLVAYLRDNGPPPKRIHISTSSDEGLSWTLARDTDLPNPGASVEAVRLKNGHWLLVYNDLERGRYSLVAALSDDEGATWRWRRHLENSTDRQPSHQFHYPSVIQGRDGAIHVTYSYFVQEGKAIKHARFTEDWVKEGDPQAP